MKSLQLCLRHTEATIHPMHAHVCASSHVEREILLEGKTSDGMRTLLFFVEGDRESYEAVLDDRPDVAEYDITPESEDGFYLYVRAPNRDQEELLFDAFSQETVVVVPPVEFRADRTMHLTLIGHPDDLQAVLDDLPDGMGVEVRQIGEYDGRVGGVLTDRQREALDAAWRVGYYEIPREGDIEAVATELDCAISTASDLLRRGEAALVGSALGASR